MVQLLSNPIDSHSDAVDRISPSDVWSRKYGTAPTLLSEK